MYLVVLAAVLPALILLFYVYKKDKQPEPRLLLLKGAFLGVLSVFVSLLLSTPLGVMGLYDIVLSTWSDAICTSFFGAAIPEELAKLFMLWLLLRKNRYFDEHMDGIVYAVAVSMGFAALENVGYLLLNYDSWQSVGIVRALVSVPAHYAFAVFMGYHYSLACFGLPSEKTYHKVMVVVLPILLHGVFDSLLFMMPLKENYAILLLVLFLVFCYYMHKYAARRIKKHLVAVP